MIDFYEQLEPAVRPIVKLLRDQGFNTTCSCGHVRYVEMETDGDGDARRLVDTLIEAGHTNFHVVLSWQFVGGKHYRLLRVEFGRDITGQFLQEVAKGREYNRIEEMIVGEEG